MPSTKKFKTLFHRACEATWLTKDDVVQQVRTTCESERYLKSKTTTMKYRDEQPLVDVSGEKTNF